MLRFSAGLARATVPRDARSAFERAARRVRSYARSSNLPRYGGGFAKRTRGRIHKLRVRRNRPHGSLPRISPIRPRRAHFLPPPAIPHTGQSTKRRDRAAVRSASVRRRLGARAGTSSATVWRSGFPVFHGAPAVCVRVPPGAVRRAAGTVLEAHLVRDAAANSP